MTGLRRAVAEFRLGPRSFLRNALDRPRIDAEDLQEIGFLKRFFGPPPEAPISARRLVLLSYMAIPYGIKMEVVLARLLQRAGWSVTAVASASSEPMVRAYHQPLIGCEVLRLEDFLDFGATSTVRAAVAEAIALARRDIGAFKSHRYHGAPLALHALASFAAARPDGVVQINSQSLRVLQRLLRRSMLLYHAADAMYAELHPALALGVEKGFVTTCETFYAALNRGLDFVQWVGCHEPDSVMFKRYRRENSRDHPFSISERNWAKLRSTPWNESYREAVLAEFRRGYEQGAWFRYKGLVFGHDFAERADLQRRLKLDPDKKTAVIYAHILNDATLFYGTDLFARGYEEWLVETIRAAEANRQVNWVLKIHPANRYRNAKTGYTGEYGELLALKRAFGTIPAFLRIVTPEEQISPLSFFGITDYGITVRGTVGLELPCFGIPVLTCGTGRYSGKGFTVDSSDAADYRAKLSEIHRIPRLSEEQTRLGILYAYHVFRSRPARYGEVMTDVYEKPVQHPRNRDVRFRAASLRELLAHPQILRMRDFLESSEEDFLEAAS